MEKRPVIILDDTLDKGVTAKFAETHLLSKGAASVDLAVLVQKDQPRTAYPTAAFYGFLAPGGQWLTGMGLDDIAIAPEANRWAGYIAEANPA